jgi:hypothetical protein
MLFDRGGGKRSPKQRVSRDGSFSGPTKGLIKSQRVGRGPDGGAEVLQNIFPTTEGGKVRGGSVTRATLPTAVIHLTNHDTSTPKLFGATATGIFDITSPASPSLPPVAAVSGLTSGDWSSLQFQAGGGNYLMMVNGVDDWREFNGTTWAARNAGSSPAITGILTSKLSQVWSFGRRVWAIENNTLSAWYLPILSRAGAMTEFPLGSIFKLGGALLFGATWSTDSGSGFSENCAFVTTKGEVAVYQGADPATDMKLVNVYRIGTPLHKNGYFKAGGDLGILTEEGIQSLSAAINTDVSGLSRKSITAPVHEDWISIVKERLPGGPSFNCTLWSRETMLVIGVPKISGDLAKCLVSNSISGGWAEYTNWDVSCSVVFNNKLYFGSSDGKIREGDTTGTDDGAPFHCVYIPSFTDNSKPNEKTLLRARCWIRSSLPYSIQLFGKTDFDAALPAPTSFSVSGDASTWENAIWDNPGSLWQGSGRADLVQSQWQDISGLGVKVSVGFSFLSNFTGKPNLEIVSTDYVYEDGWVMG